MLVTTVIHEERYPRSRCEVVAEEQKRTTSVEAVQDTANARKEGDKEQDAAGGGEQDAAAAGGGQDGAWRR